MAFSPTVREEALVRSRRCCCVCHEFFGRALEVHHIIQKADGGPDTLENAIVLCDRCHGEAGHYNARHPLGSKYSASELQNHKDAWWEWCRLHPNMPLPKHPINLSPYESLLSSEGWFNYPIIRVTNNADRPLYGINISASPIGVPPDSTGVALQFEPLDAVHEDLVHLGGVTFEIGMGLQLGFTDGSRCIILPAINPKETRRIKVTHNIRVDGNKVASARFSIDSFSEEPSPILKK